MHSFAAYCEPLSNNVKVTIVIPVTNVDDEIAGSQAIIALSSCSLLLKCLIK